MPPTQPLRLTKHHGLGNDFLVLLDPSGDPPVTADLARVLCARHTGIGADGLLCAGRGSADVDAVMTLYNADGSRAEMSGNGIRCLAQALLLADWATPPDITIATEAGIRVVSLRGDQADAATHVLAVDMGPATLGGDATEWTGGPLRRAAWADMGNPHLVVEVDDPAIVAGFDLVTLGEKVNAALPEGANVHLVAADTPTNTVTVRTYERGVGPTQACGTGACASAAVAHEWGLVGESVTVRMPGGTADVHLGDTVELVGPAVAIATIEWPCR